jgi:hypothetical protein
MPDHNYSRRSGNSFGLQIKSATDFSSHEPRRGQMNTQLRKSLMTVVPAVILLYASQISAQTPIASGARADQNTVIDVHAEGAQIYECKPDSNRMLTWQFREPIATLFVDGKSAGRHYAGPNWDYVDGSGVKGKVVASEPGATPEDIPWLKAEVTEHRGAGILSDATAVQRINTKGGMLQGSCGEAGAYRSVPYSAQYVFLRKGS